MILLFTDFGLEGPYAGQVKAALWREAPRIPVFDLFADLPPGRIQGAAYLLAAYAASFLGPATFLCVVDPGVGTARPAEALRIDGRWFVGPGNGLFEPLVRRARKVEGFAAMAAGAGASATFHGRDVFAPLAARLARGDAPDACGLTPAAPTRRPDWPDELAEIVYIDRFGNAMTGLRAPGLAEVSRLSVAGRSFARARTFAEVAPGAAFWFENANGLAEIAVNLGRADVLPGIQVGAPVVTAAL